MLWFKLIISIMKPILYITILLTSLFAACSKDKGSSPNQPVEKIKIAEKATPSGLSVTLWADKQDFSVAYNKVYLTVKNPSGSNVSNATVSYLPVMDMMTMSHSCPVEQPSYNAEKGYYEGAATFSMATG